MTAAMLIHVDIFTVTNFNMRNIAIIKDLHLRIQKNTQLRLICQVVIKKYCQYFYKRNQVQV